MIDPDGYQPEPLRQWHVRSVVEDFGKAVEAQSRAPVLSVPAIIGGREVSVGTLESVDPGKYERVVATAASVGEDAADDVVAGLSEAHGSWSDRSHEDRAEVLVRAATWMRERRDNLAALEVFEAGKPWDEADADVCEAIDFCEYYARQAILLGRGGVVQSPPGEENRLEYFGRGVAAVIGPWNFPLAIPTGLTTAALVAGNAVALKPAEQTPAIAYQLIEALRAAGLPEGVLAFVPGPGEEIGAALVAHPGVQTIAFTGSKEVGLAIIEEAGKTRPGQAFVKRVVAEMGGKNAMIIDSDADLDQAVPAVARSAFGFAGQKCSAASRVFVMQEIYDEFIDRLIAHSATLEVGHPSAASVVVGPVIDADAHARLTSAVAGTAGTVRLGEAVQTTSQPAGWYVPPTIVDGLPSTDRIMTDELFGPVVAVSGVDDVDRAISDANNTDYALTAGIYSRSPETVARAVRRLRAGNIYVNRTITGSIVGRQPFGGHGLSGTGPKAGGPDYLQAFSDSKSISENTIRQGFAPDYLN